MITGLSSSEAELRLNEYGPNVLLIKKQHTVLSMIFSQFKDLMVIILIVSSGIAIGMGIYEDDQTGILDGVVILGIVLLNGSIGFFQEFKTEKTLEALKKLIAPTVTLFRDGNKTRLKADEIVPGDVVVLSGGDKISADGVLLPQADLQIDEASLTGESVPVQKSENQEVFMGTSVASGSGLMLVKLTGMQTQFGRIAKLTTTTVQDQSPLQKEMFAIGVFVTKITLFLSGILIVVGYLVQGKSFLDSLLFAVSVAVAAVPEGLPTTITVALALGVQALARKQAVIKKLSSVETLGATTVICTDKTGTLTKNEMTVTEILLGHDMKLMVSGSGYDPESGAIHSEILHEELKKMKQIAYTCTEAELQQKDGKYHVLGDPTEGALLTFALKALHRKERELLEKTEVKKVFPFDSVRKMMSVLTTENELWTKGSPDEVLKRCDRIFTQGKIRTINDSDREFIKDHYTRMASQALRVIAFAFRDTLSLNTHGIASSSLSGAPRNDIIEENFIFVGLAGMIDPPREEVKHAVQLCKKAGIRILVITGDYGITAKAIGKQIGLADDQTTPVLGEDLEKMTDPDLDTLLKSNHHTKSALIFSRVNPEHKRRIVDRLKFLNEVVAVTGDGVNDAPALKRADLGIAMGITGTEVSKETANMILLDDSFASIVEAVKEGRKIYANLKKFTWFIFSTNIGELVVVFFAILLQVPAPLTALLILAVNVGTDLFPAIALGVDHAEPRNMERPPRNPSDRILSKPFITHFLLLGLFMGSVVLGLYFWKLSSFGWNFGDELSLTDPKYLEAVSMAFATLVIIQLCNAFNARSFHHSIFKLPTLWYLWGAVLLSVLLVVAMLHLPSLQNLFHTKALTLSDWVLVFAASTSVIVVEELRKLWLFGWSQWGAKRSY